MHGGCWGLLLELVWMIANHPGFRAELHPPAGTMPISWRAGIQLNGGFGNVLANALANSFLQLF